MRINKTQKYAPNVGTRIWTFRNPLSVPYILLYWRHLNHCISWHMREQSGWYVNRIMYSTPDDFNSLSHGLLFTDYQIYSLTYHCTTFLYYIKLFSSSLWIVNHIFLFNCQTKVSLLFSFFLCWQWHSLINNIYSTMNCLKIKQHFCKRSDTCFIK